MATTAHLPSEFRAGALFRLALPMIVSRAGLAAMGIADGIMVARCDPHEFAALSLADGTLGRLLDVFIAFLIGGLLLIPRHFASGDTSAARQIWARTIPVSIGLGFVGLFIGLAGKSLLLLTGQKPELAATAAPVMAILGMGYPAALLAIAAAVYLEGINRPQLVAGCVVGANILNLVLNWLLIGGHAGFPAMGARGSALSTTAVRCALGIALVAIACVVNKSLGGPPTTEQADERNKSYRAQWRLSFGTAASVAAMVVLGSSLTIFAGWLGALSLAVFSAAWGLAAPAMLIAMGMSDAAGICVSGAAGRGDDHDAASVAWASLRLTLMPIAAIAIAVSVLANSFAAVYANDPAMRRSIASVLPLVALILVVDSCGFVMVACLRALREAAWPAVIEIGSLVCMVPLAASLAIGRGMGVGGLFLAMLATALIRAALLAARFQWRTRTVLASQTVAV
jgi:MATE family multidrug resistance protein